MLEDNSIKTITTVKTLLIFYGDSSSTAAKCLEQHGELCIDFYQTSERGGYFGLLVWMSTVVQPISEFTGRIVFAIGTKPKKGIYMNRAVLGRLIKEERLKLEMTQDEFGSLINTDKKKISRLERGMQFPDEDLIRVLRERGGKVDEIINAIFEIRKQEEGTRRFGMQSIPLMQNQLTDDLTAVRDTINFLVPTLSKEIRELSNEIKGLREEILCLKKEKRLSSAPIEQPGTGAIAWGTAMSVTES